MNEKKNKNDIFLRVKKQALMCQRIVVEGKKKSQ